MVFNSQSWHERFEQARQDKNVNLVRELVDELVAAYSKINESLPPREFPRRISNSTSLRFSLHIFSLHTSRGISPPPIPQLWHL